MKKLEIKVIIGLSLGIHGVVFAQNPGNSITCSGSLGNCIALQCTNPMSQTINLTSEQLNQWRAGNIAGTWSHNAAWNTTSSFQQTDQNSGRCIVVTRSNFDSRTSCTRNSITLNGNTLNIGFQTPCGNW